MQLLSVLWVINNVIETVKKEEFTNVVQAFQL